MPKGKRNKKAACICLRLSLACQAVVPRLWDEGWSLVNFVRLRCSLLLSCHWSLVNYHFPEWPLSFFFVRSTLAEQIAAGPLSL